MSEASPASSGPDRSRRAPGPDPGPSGGASPTPKLVDWLLTGADWVVTCDESMRCIPSGALAMDGDSLVAVGPSEELRPLFRGRREMDLKGCLVLPGLVNTHTHAAMTCFRGMGSDLPLLRWLHEIIFPAESAHVNPGMVYHGTLLAAVEALSGGTTTLCDGYFFEESAARAAIDSGIRAVLGQGILDFPTPDNPDPAESRRRTEDFLAAFPSGEPRVRPSLFCHAPYTCGPDTLQWVKELCRSRGILFQIHLSETASEVRDILRLHGKRPVPYLDSLGILDAMTLCAHGIWLDESEIEILAGRGAGISHNPESNMKLASGVAPVSQLLAAGVPVGLGTDGAASNNNLDLFAEMGMAARLEKVFRKDPSACPAHQALRMATLGGARTLGMEDAVGSLEAGKRADVIAVDLNQPHLTPLYNPVSHLVYAVKAGDVRHVWVNGRRVVEAGRVLTTDVPALIAEVRSILVGENG